MIGTKRRGAGWEQAAALYLSEHGANVLEMNFTVPGAEIDIVCETDGYLVFAEVKQRFSERFGDAAEAVNAGKRQRIRKAAAIWRERHPQNTLPVRFDVIEITPDGLLHHTGAFDFD